MQFEHSKFGKVPNVQPLIIFGSALVQNFDTQSAVSILSIPVHPYSKIVGKMVHKGDKGGQVLFDYTVVVIYNQIVQGIVSIFHKYNIGSIKKN